MRTGIICSLLCLIFLSNDLCAKRITTFPVYINSPDSSVHAHVMNNSGNCKAKARHRYYWYGKNNILSSEGGFSGRLLHGDYTSYYSNNNLLCKGKFNRGLKNGTWFTWHRNGMVRERSHFANGLLNGAREIYDSTGFLMMRIYYRNGVLAGKTTIFSQNKSDTVIRFKNGHAVDTVTNNDSQKIRKSKIKEDKDSTVGKKYALWRWKEPRDSISDSSATDKSAKKNKSQRVKEQAPDKIAEQDHTAPVKKKKRMKNIFRKRNTKVPIESNS